jgi:pyridoxamine 5'-phosphate oxidase-like protein
MFVSILSHEGAADVVAGARVCYVGVQSRFGPHVTPDAFAVAGGRAWFVTSIASVKARSIRQRPKVGILLRSEKRSLVLNGNAEILSMWAPTEAFRLAKYSVPATLAFADFAKRNVGTLLGYALDLCQLPSGAMPIDRVLISVRPSSGLLLEGKEVLERWVPHHVVASGEPVQMPASRRIELPAAVADLLEHPSEAAVGWPTARGTVVFPGTWDPRTTKTRVSAEAFHAYGAPTTGQACVTIDDSTARRPTKFRGVILRGTGRFAKGDVELSIERATWWKGFETGTSIGEISTAGAPRPRAAASS